ncbi:MAG: hypothetical protein ACOY40_09055 [Bacillota bacterium]
MLATSGGSGKEETAVFLEWVVKRTGVIRVGKMAVRIAADGLLPWNHLSLKEARSLGKRLMVVFSILANDRAASISSFCPGHASN